MSTNESNDEKEQTDYLDLSGCSLTDQLTINSNDSFEFCANVNTDRSKLFNQLFDVYTKHNLSLSALEDIARLINNVPGATINIPTYKYSLLNEFNEKNKHNFHKRMLCSGCKEYTEVKKDEKNELCIYCDAKLGKETPQIFCIGLKPQLEDIIRRNSQAIFDFRLKILENDKQKIIDVYSGSVMCELTKNEFIYSLSLNTDGVEVQNSNKDHKSVWPVIFVCNFLPPEIRFKKRNMILVSLYHSNEKPDFLKYFDWLSEEINALRFHGITLDFVNYKFAVSVASLDLPAKCAVQQITQFNGYEACSYCHHEGVKTNKGIRYTEPSNMYPLRTHESMKSAMIKLSEKTGKITSGSRKRQASSTQHGVIKQKHKTRKNSAKKYENGVKGISPMIGFSGFDLGKSWGFDYMHGVLLGVCRKLFDLYLNSASHGKPYYIIPRSRLILNKRLSKMKPCRFISRKVYSLNKYITFKASEYRTILLYYFVAFKNILPKKYYDHLRLLTSSVYTLLQSSIPRQKLDKVEANIKLFVIQFQNYFGEEHLTMNVHALTHMVECVRQLGPLWAQSMFCYEAFNGYLRKYVVAPNDVMNQMVTKYIVEHKYDKKSVDLVERDIDITLKSELSSYEFSESETELFQNMGITIDENIELFSLMKKSSIVFTSTSYSGAKKTADYFVETVDSRIGKVKFFFHSCEKFYAVIEEYKVNETIDQIRYVTSKASIFVCDAISISDKFIYVNFGTWEYIVLRPNPYEVN